MPEDNAITIEFADGLKVQVLRAEPGVLVTVVADEGYAGPRLQTIRLDADLEGDVQCLTLER